MTFSPHRVAVYIRPGVPPMELGLIHQLLGGARDPDGRPLYRVVTCARRPGSVRTTADIDVTVPHGIDAVEAADTVVIPAAEPDYEITAPVLADSDAELFARIRRDTRIATVCTGAALPAAAGLLDGRRATTHWAWADRYAALFPRVRWDPDVLYVDEGDLLTAAGEAAGIDLCLHLIRRDHGAAVAADVARRTVVPPHREGGQAQYVPSPVPPRADDSTAATRQWALTHLHRPLPLAELAGHAAMSTRTFTRRFRQETGLSPAQWLTAQRVARVRELLERTDHTVDRIAAESGFGTATALRQQLRAAVGLSPSAYRRTFRQP
ncbi:transcriptional regulator GlxA family with amidase domain [Stackebrandtia albiflava]|uniref:Transcriptional regulator GlxA family with amidase domain n=1 Tax=Stackebrandtia albiflava TaxID=406432 RepID=A0A562V2M7_9ACTN|nr:helix-turn-helix domain-containing protein [Stackebrandtia albiflava]TWJ12093.1 transcriptional regulator GlxA family with amidase domain [Stackebrandtia albiflava]